MEKLNSIREFSNINSAEIKLISKKQLKKNKNAKLGIDNLIYGKLITISLTAALEKQITFFEELITFTKTINIYLNSILIDNVYYTITNLKKLFKLHTYKNNNSFNLYNIIYFFQILKYRQFLNINKTHIHGDLQNTILNTHLIKKII